MPIRPWKGPWAWQHDFQDATDRRIHRHADRSLWNRVGKLIGVPGYQLTAAFSRMIDERVDSYVRTQLPTLLDQLTDPGRADALRNAIGDLLCDDIAAMVQILTSKGSDNDARDVEETPGRGEPDAADHERQIHQAEDDAAEDAGDARE